MSGTPFSNVNNILVHFVKCSIETELALALYKENPLAFHNDKKYINMITVKKLIFKAFIICKTISISKII